MSESSFEVHTGHLGGQNYQVMATYSSGPERFEASIWVVEDPASFSRQPPSPSPSGFSSRSRPSFQPLSGGSSRDTIQSAPATLPSHAAPFVWSAPFVPPGLPLPAPPGLPRPVPPAALPPPTPPTRVAGASSWVPPASWAGPTPSPPPRLLPRVFLARPSPPPSPAPAASPAQLRPPPPPPRPMSRMEIIEPDYGHHDNGLRALLASLFCCLRPRRRNPTHADA